MLSKKLIRLTARAYGFSRPVATRRYIHARCSVSMSCRRRLGCNHTILRRCLSVESHQSSVNVDEPEGEKSQAKQSTEKTEGEIRKEILENALNYVHTHGWSQALVTSAEELGYPSVVEGIFKDGESELVLYFVRSCNISLVHYMEELHDDKRIEKTSEFIRDVVEHRLRMVIPHIDSWPEAMAIMMQPPTIFEAAQELGKMVDDIWFYAGDKSTDINWYTKRGILAKLYASTQAVMLSDQSPDFRETWEFLDRRMKDVAAFGKITTAIQRQGRMVADVGFAGFTVLRNIAGFGESRR